MLQRKVQRLIENNPGINLNSLQAENEDVENLKQFWKIIERSAKKGALKDQRDYYVENNLLYISLDDVYKVYLEYCTSKRKIKWSKEKIRALIKEVYLAEHVRKRFFGRHPGKWCYKLKYCQVGIKLI